MEPLDITFDAYFSNNLLKFMKDVSVKEYIDSITNVSNEINNMIQTLNNNKILHGDLHSNNIMFKLDKNRNIKDVKIIDFSRSEKISKNSTNVDLKRYYNEFIGYTCMAILTALFMIKFNNRKEYEDWKQTNESKIYNYIENLLQQNERLKNSFTIEDKDDTEKYPFNKWHTKFKVYYILSKDLYSILHKFFLDLSTHYSEKVIPFFYFITNLLQVDLNTITIGNILKTIKETNIYLSEIQFIHKFFEDEYKFEINKILRETYGYISDCKHKVIRKKIINKNLVTTCDWTPIGNTSIASGADGEAWLVKCN
jgi:serine/threonine-protein kinase RIO1